MGEEIYVAVRDNEGTGEKARASVCRDVTVTTIDKEVRIRNCCISYTLRLSIGVCGCYWAGTRYKRWKREFSMVKFPTQLLASLLTRHTKPSEQGT